MSTYKDKFPWYEPGPRPRDTDKPTLCSGDNPEVGRLLGPKGELMKIVRAKEEIPFGFSKT